MWQWWVWFWHFVGSVMTTFVSKVPDPPGVVADVAANISMAMGFMQNGLCGWVNGAALGASVGIVVAGWSMGLALRIVRILASFATLGGGSA